MHTRPGFKMFRPLGYHWYVPGGAQYYLKHFYMELGRLGYTSVHEITLPAQIGDLVHDLNTWLGDRDNEHHLYEWQNLNFPMLWERQQKRDPHQWHMVKPRIELSAHLTARGNLSVLWHPAGWGRTVHRDNRPTGFDYRDDRKHIAPIPFRQKSDEAEPECDFLMFAGDETRDWNTTPNNELMFIHGVGEISAYTLDGSNYPHLGYNVDVVNSLLICAVRSAYESLIRRLEENFEVTVRRVFVFVTGDDDRIVSWSLEDPVVLKQREDQKAYTDIEKKYGFTVEKFEEEIGSVSFPKKGSDEPPDIQLVNDRLVRKLRKAGHQITLSGVEQLRALIKRVRDIPAHS